MKTESDLPKRLLFAVNAYSNLKAGEKDVINIFNVFTEEDIGACHKGISEPIHSCNSKHDFSVKLNKFLHDWNPDNQLIFYYSGHGIVKNDKFHFEFGIDGGKTIYPFENLINELDSFDVKKTIILIDACFSGRIAKNEPESGYEYEKVVLPKGRVFISSSSAIQLSFEEEDGSGSVFTNLLCQGLKTGLKNTKTPDGFIYADDILSYINAEIKNPKYLKKNQTPNLKLLNADKSIWIAKNRSGKLEIEKTNFKPLNAISNPTDLRILYERTNILEHPCSDADIEFLDWQLISNFFDSEKRKKKIDAIYENMNKHEILNELGLFSTIKVDGEKKLNKSAVICFHKYPEKYYPFLQSKFTILSSNESIISLEKEVEGPISYQIERFKNLIEDKLSFTFFDTRGNRVQSNFEEEDIIVIRELLSNAFAHRDYNEISPIQVGIFPQYIEIKNPGLFPDDLKWDELIRNEIILSKPKNSLITYYLAKQLSYEGIGRGFSIIRDYIRKNGNDSIVYSEIIGSFTSVRLKIKSTSQFYNKPQSININTIEIDLTNLIGTIRLDKRLHKEAILAQTIVIRNWSSEIYFKDLTKPKKLSDIYVEPEFLTSLRRLKLNENPVNKTLGLKNVVFDTNEHIIIIGGPGSGKTTAMKMITNFLLIDNAKQKFKIPIVIRLREIKSDKNRLRNFILYQCLAELLGLSIVIDGRTIRFSSITSATKHQLSEMKSLISKFLNNLKAIVILDGIDEISEFEVKDEVLINIRELGAQLKTSKIVVTSRTGEFQSSIRNFLEFELCPFSEEMIDSFIRKWINDEKQSENFLLQFREIPYNDTRISPLILAHLVAIYERYGSIPEKPKTIYKKIINLLLEEWDLQRSIFRKSKLFDFEIEKKYEFLTSLSFHITTLLHKSVFNYNDLKKVYQKVHRDFGLPKSEMKLVINELESVTGLLIKSSYDSYEFSHKSIQEYLCADYIIKLPTLSTVKIENIPNELAIATGISSNPSLYFLNLIDHYFVENEELVYDYNFNQSFINRIIIEKPDFNNYNIDFVVALHYYNTLNIIKSNNKVIDLVESILGKNAQVLYWKILLEDYVVGNNDNLMNIKTKKYVQALNNGYVLLSKIDSDYPRSIGYPKFLIMKKTILLNL